MSNQSTGIKCLELELFIEINITIITEYEWTRYYKEN